MTGNAYYRALLIAALKQAAEPLSLMDLVDNAIRFGIDKGAVPADLAGLSGRVANILLRGLVFDQWVVRVQPKPDAAPLLRYELTGKGRAYISAERNAEPPYPRPVSVDMAAARRATTSRTRKAARTADEQEAAAFCRDFMQDAAATLNRVQTDIARLKRKYEMRYREVSTPK